MILFINGVIASSHPRTLLAQGGSPGHVAANSSGVQTAVEHSQALLWETRCPPEVKGEVWALCLCIWGVASSRICTFTLTRGFQQPQGVPPGATGENTVCEAWGDARPCR